MMESSESTIAGITFRASRTARDDVMLRAQDDDPGTFEDEVEQIAFHRQSQRAGGD